MIGETVGGDGWLSCIGSLLSHPATMNRAADSGQVVLLCSRKITDSKVVIALKGL